MWMWKKMPAECWIRWWHGCQTEGISSWWCNGDFRQRDKNAFVLGCVLDFAELVAFCVRRRKGACCFWNSFCSERLCPWMPFLLSGWYCLDSFVHQQEMIYASALDFVKKVGAPYFFWAVCRDSFSGPCSGARNIGFRTFFLKFRAPEFLAGQVWGTFLTVPEKWLAEHFFRRFGHRYILSKAEVSGSDTFGIFNRQVCGGKMSCGRFGKALGKSEGNVKDACCVIVLFIGVVCSKEVFGLPRYHFFSALWSLSHM